ncbi:MAG TPA: response regulator, partial [Allocoleopsis sp.]
FNYQQNLILFLHPQAQESVLECLMQSVLVVDDSATMRRMIIASLHDLGDVNFSQASNGLEAIERLALSPTDIMILDLNMPDMHGMEVLKFVREQPSYKDLPVIILTTKGDEESRNAANVAGASAYITKPFEPEKLVQKIRDFLP